MPMVHRFPTCIAVLLLSTAASGAELFYMDHDPFTNEYVGAVGPLVLSGEVRAGDYDRLLSKIAEDGNRFIASGKLILASEGGDVPEAIKIAKLIRSLYTEVVVGPLTGRCAGACFLIYTAASQRGTDGERLIGIYRPAIADEELDSVPPAQAALLEDKVADQARGFLQENAVPTDLIDEMFRSTPQDVYWLSERDEQNLGSKSPSFEQLLAAKCAWNDSLERAVYKGERPMEDLKEIWVCRARVTQPAAHKALELALKERSAEANDKTKDTPPCHKKGRDPNTPACPKDETKVKPIDPPASNK
jgi:hypothetical protein